MCKQARINELLFAYEDALRDELMECSIRELVALSDKMEQAVHDALSLLGSGLYEPDTEFYLDIPWIPFVTDARFKSECFSLYAAFAALLDERIDKQRRELEYEFGLSYN